MVRNTTNSTTVLKNCPAKSAVDDIPRVLSVRLMDIPMKRDIIVLLNGHVRFAAEGIEKDTSIKEDLKQNKRTESQR
jgi:hypothetical protein